MSEFEDDHEAEETLVLMLFQAVGGLVRWLFFLGKKSFKEIHRRGFLNRLIGFLVLLGIAILCFNQIVKLVISFI